MNNLTYYKGQYLVEGSSWYLKKKHLDQSVFDKNLYNKGYSKIALFNSYMTKFIAVDIDAHDGNTIKLAEAYNELYNKFAEPSFVVKSPHGLHAYYLLSDFFPSQQLVIYVQSRVKKLKYSSIMEVKPTTKSGLRSPNVHQILNPLNLNEKLKIKKDSFESFLDSRVHYHPEELNLDSVSKKSAKVIPSDIIRKGATNDALNYFVPRWRSLGLTPEEITLKFQENLEPGYRGECTSYSRVLKRVKSYFKNFDPTPFTHSISSEDIEMKYRKLIDNIVSLYTNKNKHNEKLRRESIKKDLIKILTFHDTSVEIFSNKETKYLHAEKNPYFLYEMSRGCIPIASKAIKLNNFQFFKQIGFLSLPYGKHYHVALHSCIHYKFNFDLLSKDKTQNLTVKEINNKVDLVKKLVEELVEVSTVAHSPAHSHLYVLNCSIYLNKDFRSNFSDQSLKKVKKPPDYMDDLF